MVSESETTDGETESESAANPESISAQDEDEKDFGTIRAFFDEDKHFYNEYEEGVIVVIIGKMYDHIVKLYGGGGERQPEYEKVLRTIKAVYPLNEEEYHDWELIKEAEMTLKRIEGDLQSQNSIDMSYYDYGDYSRALRALLDHVVKMDEGNCSSHYKSLFSFIYYTIHDVPEWMSGYVYDWKRKRVELVVRKLGAIENRKKEGARHVDNATKDDESAASPESILAQDEDKKDFGTIRAFFDEDEHSEDDEKGVIIVIIGKMYDHMLKLYGGGGEHQPEYEKLLSTIRAFYSLNDEDDYPYHPRELIDKVEMTLMRIATGNTNTETKGLILMDVDYDCNYYDFPLVEILRALFDHVIEMDEGNCSSHYISLVSFIYNTIHTDDTWTRDHVVNWRRMTVEVVVRMLGAIENRKKEGARHVDNATKDDAMSSASLSKAVAEKARLMKKERAAKKGAPQVINLEEDSSSRREKRPLEQSSEEQAALARARAQKKVRMVEEAVLHQQKRLLYVASEKNTDVDVDDMEVPLMGQGASVYVPNWGYTYAETPYDNDGIASDVMRKGVFPRDVSRLISVPTETLRLKAEADAYRNSASVRAMGERIEMLYGSLSTAEDARDALQSRVDDLERERQEMFLSAEKIKEEREELKKAKEDLIVLQVEVKEAKDDAELWNKHSKEIEDKYKELRDSFGTFERPGPLLRQFEHKVTDEVTGRLADEVLNSWDKGFSDCKRLVHSLFPDLDLSEVELDEPYPEEGDPSTPEAPALPAGPAPEEDALPPETAHKTAHIMAHQAHSEVLVRTPDVTGRKVNRAAPCGRGRKVSSVVAGWTCSEQSHGTVPRYSK